MSFSIVIPARYDSSRLPGKPLLDIAGKPMLQHVYERACETGAKQILIATDDSRVFAAASTFGAEVCMTSEKCASGTDRIAEAISHLDIDENEIIVNVQGDEPLLPGELIKQTALLLEKQPIASISTLSEPLASVDELMDPNIVKVVTDINGIALYFSRAPIPWDRTSFLHKEAPDSIDKQLYQRHIGLYAYRAKFLNEYRDMQVCKLEETECLEQLRAMYFGARIVVGQASCHAGHGVDTPADLEKVRGIFAKT